MAASFWRSALPRWASSTATSAPARSTRSRSASRRSTAWRRPRANVLGILSLVFWSLNFVVTFKYLTFIMRADNRGEGGIMALLALLSPQERRRAATGGFSSRWASSARRCCTATASSLRPSRCSAPSKGFAWPRPRLPDWGVPAISALILVALFVFQRRGTAKVGAVFGRVMVVWFVSIVVARPARHHAASRRAPGAEPLVGVRVLRARRAPGLPRARSGGARA